MSRICLPPGGVCDGTHVCARSRVCPSSSRRRLTFGRDHRDLSALEHSIDEPVDLPTKEVQAQRGHPVERSLVFVEQADSFRASSRFP